MATTIQDITRSGEPIKTQIGFKVTAKTKEVLHAVYQWRKEQGLSSDFSEFMRQVIEVALLLDKPEIYLPQFEIPNIEHFLNDLYPTEKKEDPNNETETQETEN